MKTPPNFVQDAARKLREAQARYAEALAHGGPGDQERAIKEIDRARIALAKADQEALAIKGIAR